MALLVGYQIVKKQQLLSKVACLLLFTSLLLQVGCLNAQGPQNTTSSQPNEVVATTPVPSAEPSQEAIATTTMLPTESIISSQDRLAYLGPDRNLWIVNADGSGQKRLTEFEEGIDGLFDWSPDGQEIAFHKSEYNGTESVYVFNLKDDSLVQLATGFESVNTFNRFSWSPNSTQMTFVESLIGEGVLYIVNSDGSGLKELFRRSYFFDTHWLPDNRRISLRWFDSPSDQMEVYVVDVSDGSLTRIFQGYQLSLGRGLLRIHDDKIVFSGSADPDSHEDNIYFADPTTGDLSPLISEALREEEPHISCGSFSPGGDKAICWTWSFDTPSPYGEHRLYVIDLHSGSTRFVWSYESPGDFVYPTLAWLSDNETVVCGISSCEAGDYAGVYTINVTTQEAMPLAGSLGNAMRSMNGLDFASLLSVFNSDDRILLSGASKGQIEQLYLMQADGTGLTMVARGYFLVDPWFRGWSSNGDMVIQAREAGEDTEVNNIYIIGQDGQVLWKAPNAECPVWQYNPPPR